MTSPPVWFIAGLVSLTFAWMLGNAPLASPDEWAHFVRAVSIGHGQLVGEAADYPGSSLTLAQSSWVNMAAREVSIPPNLDPRGYTCHSRQLERSASCLDEAGPSGSSQRIIPNGTYQPAMYVIPGLLARTGAQVPAADLLGRFGSAATSLVFLGAGVAAFWSSRRPQLSLIPILVSLSPMVLFVSSSLTPSGPEIAAAFAFVSAWAAYVGGRGRTWIAVTLGASGAALAVSHSTGPFYLVALVVACSLWSGPRALRDLVGRHRVGSIVLGSIFVAAVSANRLWEHLHGPDEVPLRLTDPVSDIWRASGFLPKVLREEVGVFGFLDVRMPSLTYVVWAILVVVVLAAAFAVGSRWQRIGVAAAIAIALAAPVLLYAAFLQHVDFGIQGRHVLALAVAVPLLAGATITQRAGNFSSLGLRWPAPWWAVVVSAIHMVGWYTNARRHAVGTDGPILFLGRSSWEPVLGWGVPLVLALAGSLLIMGSGLLAARRPGSPGPLSGSGDI